VRPDNLAAKFRYLGVVSSELPCQLSELQVRVICSLLDFGEQSSDSQQPDAVPGLSRVWPVNHDHAPASRRY